MTKMKLLTPYEEGYAAFKGTDGLHLLPSACPYLNETGDSTKAITEWLDGYSDALANFFTEFHP